MKKILLSIMMVVAGISAASATTTTLNCQDPTSLGYVAPTGTKGDAQFTLIDVAKGIVAGNIKITVTNKDGAINSNSAKFWNGASYIDFRAYKGGSLTFSTTNGENITKIEFAGNKVVTGMTFDSGVYTPGTKAGSWDGMAATVGITVTATLNINTITVTTVGGAITTVAIPVLTPKGGTYYEPQTVSMSCATEGADIKYTLDGGDPIAYTAPIVVSKTTTIMAQASKKGLTDSGTIETIYTILPLPEVANIAAFNALPKGDIAKITGAVTAIFQDGRYLFMNDASGSLQVYGDLGTAAYTNGDVLSGITGTVGEYGGVKQMVPVVESFGTATKGTSVVAKVVTSAEAKTVEVNSYIIIKNATIARTFPDDPKKAKNFTVTDAAGTIDAYSRFTSSVIPTDATTYDIFAITNAYNGAAQIFPVEFIASSLGVDDIETGSTSIVAVNGAININAEKASEVLVIDAAGKVVAQKAIVAGENTIEVAGGFYIVKVANKVAKVIVK